MKQKVFWANKGYRRHKPLKENISCDYLIIGGGITGVMIAYFLQEAGKKDIVLIEKDLIGSGATGKAAGIYCPVPEQWYMEHYLRYLGMSNSAKYWVAHLAAFHIMKHLIEKKKIDCDYEYAPIFCLESPHAAIHEVFKEYKFYSWLHMKIKLLTKKELDHEVHASLFSKGFKLWSSMSVNPLKLVQNIAAMLGKNGLRIYEKSQFIEQKGNIVKTPKGNIMFRKAVVYATDSWTPKIRPVETTIAVTRPLPEKLIKKLNPEEKMMFWDVKKKSYHYGKFTKDHRILVGFGDKIMKKPYESKNPEKSHLTEIRKFIRRLMPNDKIPIEYAWSGIYGNNEGLLPFLKIGKEKAVIAGAASQITAVMLAKYAAAKLLRKKNTLDTIFLDKN
ncbi:MAG TPA: FAD-binding oxidoreductase [Candidatus Nanoarchaeia archaeon]|nr:FAD-binding oxidoreductase [Candidatus Nanoarchaeia archaeon]